MLEDVRYPDALLMAAAVRAMHSGDEGSHVALCRGLSAAVNYEWGMGPFVTREPGRSLFLSRTLNVMYWSIKNETLKHLHDVAVGADDADLFLHVGGANDEEDPVGMGRTSAAWNSYHGPFFSSDQLGVLHRIVDE